MKSDLHDVYVIYQHATERAVCIREHEGGKDIWIFDTLEAAKAAAQADYERRILRALEGYND